MNHCTGFFKVLSEEGKPLHGGRGEWKLPTARKCGGWMPLTKPDCCESGYHLTTNPIKWWKKGARLFIAEGRGQLSGDNTDKVAFAQARLLQEVTGKWKYLPAFAGVRCFLLASDKIKVGEANLSGANLSRANLSGANLSGADLSGANLSRANLSGANLSRANLSRANLSGAHLSGANLSRANLSRANLSGANLSGANLYGANLSDIVVCRCGSTLCNTAIETLTKYGWKS